MRHRPHPGAEAEEGKWEGDRGPARRAPSGGGGGGGSGDTDTGAVEVGVSRAT
jgi:hypothetical protein